MNQFLVIGIAIVFILLLALAGLLILAWSAKKTLIRGGSTWSAKSIPIKRSPLNPKKRTSTHQGASSMLESISELTREYLNSDEEIKEHD